MRTFFFDAVIVLALIGLEFAVLTYWRAGDLKGRAFNTCIASAPTDPELSMRCAKAVFYGLTSEN